MPKRCAVDGCATGRPSDKNGTGVPRKKRVALFSTPKSPSLLEKWNQAFLGNRKKFSSGHFVCQLHFRHEDVETHFVNTTADGITHVLERSKYRLKHDAIPFNSSYIPECMVKSDEILGELNTASKDAGSSTNLVSISERYDSILQSFPGEIEAPGEGNNTKQPYPEEMRSADEENEAPHADELDAAEACEVRNNNIDRRYTIENLAQDLSCANWKEGWAWFRRSIPVAIELVQYDTATLLPRINCTISANMEITIFTGDKSARINGGTITSFAETMAQLNSAEDLKVCVGTGLQAQMRAANCPGFITPEDTYRRRFGFERCHLCRAVRAKVQKRKFEDQDAQKLRTKKKLRLLTKRHRTLQEKTTKLKTRVAQAHKDCGTREEKVIDAAIDNLPHGQQMAIRTCLATAKVKGPNGKRYAREWVYDCLLLRIKSKRAYSHLRDRDILPLPHPDTLGSYIKQMGATYGFQQVVFSCMKTKAADMAPPDRRGSLLVDEMKLSEAISLDRSTLRYTGFTSLGEHTPEHQQQQMGDHALIFMFQPFRGTWVQALACFLSKGCARSSVLEKLILECVILIESANFFVDVIVTDGATWNRGVWTSLGINEGNASCRHPCSILEDTHLDDADANEGGRRLWFISDWPHLIKTARNSFTSRDETFTPDGRLKKSHWEALVEAEESSGSILRVAFLRHEHINPMYYAKMNVPLAFELFSDRTQAAMRLLRDCGVPKLQDCDGTLVFLKRVNDVIQSMMSRCPLTALRRDNAAMKAILDFQEYLVEWERLANENWEPFITKETLRGFKVSLQATVEIFHFLEKEHGFDYLMTARLNQDALERFNGMMRSACGSNDHPDATMCARVFRLLSMYSLIKPPRGSNVTGTDVLSTLVGLKDATIDDNEKAKWLERLDRIVDNACSMDETTVDLELRDSSSDDWSSREDLHTYAEAYVAGYVARRMRASIHCDECVKTLSSETPRERDRMISLMSRGGLTFPSEALFQLLKLVEDTFLDVLGPDLSVRSESLFDVLDKLTESNRIPLLGCHAHTASITKRILNLCVMAMGHFVGNIFNRAHSDRQKETRRLRKTAKL